MEAAESGLLRRLRVKETGSKDLDLLNAIFNK